MDREVVFFERDSHSANMCVQLKDELHTMKQASLSEIAKNTTQTHPYFEAEEGTVLLRVVSELNEARSQNEILREEEEDYRVEETSSSAR